MNTIKITFLNDGMKVETNCTQYQKTQAMLEIMSEINIDLLQSVLANAYKQHKKGKNND